MKQSDYQDIIAFGAVLVIAVCLVAGIIGSIAEWLM